MSLDSFEPLDDDDFNPYAAPKATTQARRAAIEESQAESIRRDLIKREATVKSVGSLMILGALWSIAKATQMFLAAAGAIALPNEVARNHAVDPELVKPGMIAAGVIYLVFVAIGLGVGLGVRRLQAWARWTALVFWSLSLAFWLLAGLLAAFANPSVGLVMLAIFGGFTGYVVYLLASPKSGYLFTPEYRVVIEQTPHIKYRMGPVIRILLAVVGVLFLLGFIVAILKAVRP
jgi:hypothetical protein